jgi:hypothetical protein
VASKGAWFDFRCEPNCGETGRVLMPLGVNFGGASCPQLFGYCRNGHRTTVVVNDFQHGRIWISKDQSTPDWFPSEFTGMLKGSALPSLSMN